MYLKLSSEEKYNLVKRLVEKERKRRGIEEKDLGYGTSSEPSCIAYGENQNFVEFQLMRKKYDCPMTWGVMRNNETELNMALDYLLFGKRN